jgi:hypothetical protein
MLDVAKQRLDTFAAVVIHEQLDRGLEPLERLVGGKLKTPRRLNVTSEVSTVSANDRAVIASRNELDMALYEHAVARWGR